MSRARIDLGPLDLLNADRRGGSFWFDVRDNGFSLGAPEAVQTTAASLMQDGEQERTDRYGNRTVTLEVAVCATDGQGLADGERALALEVGKRNELTLTPPADFGKPTVYDVLTSWLDPIPNFRVLGQPGVKEQLYTLTLRCEPFGRSTAPIAQTFAPVAAVPTVVDPATSTAAWSAGTPFPDGGTSSVATETYDGESCIRVDWNANNPSQPQPGGPFTGVTVYWSGTKPTTELVAFDLSLNFTPYSLTLNGSAALYAEPVTLGTRTWTRYWFANPGGAAPYALFMSVSGFGARVTRIASVLSSDTPGTASVFTASTPGSVRSPGSISMARASAMTWLFVYSDPCLVASGYSPALRATWAQAPAGRYVLWARNWGVSGDVLGLTVTDDAGRSQTVTTRLTATSPATWRPVGEVMLGGFRDGRVGALTLAGTKNGASSTPADGDLRLFRSGDDTALTYLDSISATSVAIDTPTAAMPRGGMWAGNVSVFDKAVAWDFPDIVSPSTALYVEANDSTTSPITTTLTHYPRSHTWSAV